MNLDKIFGGMSIAASGLRAERRRIDTIAQNIANANVVAGPDGEPYRRREVHFASIMNKALGVEVVEATDVTIDETTPMRTVHDPSHPLADKKTGLVTYSNVNMAFEMVDMMTASRSYEANLKAMGTFRGMMRQSIRLLEG